MARVSTPPDYKIHEDIIERHTITLKIRRISNQYLSDDRALRVYNFWFSVFLKFLAYLHPIKMITNLATYSLAIFLSAQGNLICAAIVGGFGIVFTDYVGELQTIVKARKLSYKSISDYKRRERENRQLIPGI